MDYRLRILEIDLEDAKKKHIRVDFIEKQYQQMHSILKEAVKAKVASRTDVQMHDSRVGNEVPNTQSALSQIPRVGMESSFQGLMVPMQADVSTTKSATFYPEDSFHDDSLSYSRNRNGNENVIHSSQVGVKVSQVILFHGLIEYCAK
jgi:hypothetical protein